MIENGKFSLERALRVAVYCRVSTDKDDQANSLESQQKYFTEYIERNSLWKLYKVYVDEGLSGTSTSKRKAFNTMMVDAELKKFDIIITKEISRFARNTLDSIYYTRLLKEYGVGVIFANDNLYSLDPDAELRLTIMASIAQEESRKTSERVKWGQKRRMEQGVVFGRDMLGYDVCDGKLYVNKEGAKIVQKIFHKYVIEHKGTSTIARELREEGIPSYNRSGWTNTVILRVLRNEKYCGDLVQKKTITPNYLTHKKVINKGQEEFIIIQNHHEPIISRELFETTKIELSKRSPAPEIYAKYGRRYCFSGKIKCSVCGNNFVYHDKKLESGKRYKFWECYNKKKHGKTKRIDENTQRLVGCDCNQISDKDFRIIMQRVIEYINFDPQTVLKTMRQQLDEALSIGEMASYEATQSAINKWKEKKKSLLDLYLNKHITKEEFIEKAADIDMLIEQLEKELIDSVKYTMDKEDVERIISECIECAENFLDNNILIEKLIKELLQEIIVYPNKVVDVKMKMINEKWRLAVVPEKDIPKNFEN